LLRVRGDWRAWRISWLIVGIKSLPDGRSAKQKIGRKRCSPATG
jgi:hypothetical protein